MMRAKRSDPLSTIFLLLDSLVVDAIIRRPAMLDGFGLIYILYFYISSSPGCLYGIVWARMGWVGLNNVWVGLVWNGLG